MAAMLLRQLQLRQFNSDDASSAASGRRLPVEYSNLPCAEALMRSDKRTGIR